MQMDGMTKDSNFISENLSQLKKRFNKETSAQLRGKEEYERVIQLRNAFRNLAEGLEINRSLVQLKKDQIQKSKVLLEGLQYYKNTLKAKIKQCQIPLEDLTDYIEDPTFPSNWEHSFESTESILTQQLISLRKQQALFHSKQHQRQTLQVEIDNQEKLYNKELPLQAQKLYEQVEETSRIIGIMIPRNLQQIKNPKLSKIYDMLNPIQYLQKIKVTYFEEITEYIQIQILESKDNENYKIALKNKINIQPKGVKLIISDIEDISRLVIGVDRFSDFTTQEILHRLINNQQIQKVYENPVTEAERNINNKYCFLQWIENILSSGTLNGAAFIEIVRERLFCAQLNHYILNNLNKLNFIPLIKENQNSPANLKKVTLTNAIKINFKEYSIYNKVPLWVEKAIIDYEINYQKYQTQSLEYQYKNPILTSSLNPILNQFQIAERLEPNLNSYQKFNISIANQNFTVIILLPFSFPRKLSKIRIFQTLKKQETNNSSFLNGLQCLGKYTQSNYNSYQVSYIQRQINSEVQQILQPNNSSFYLFLQLHRLVTLLALTYSDQTRKDVLSKYQII